MDNSVPASGRRRAVTKTSAEDQALDQIAKEAEARLAARRQARAEAREIRTRELERQQKEIEENADRVYDMHTEPVGRTARVSVTAAAASPRLAAATALATNSFQSSRRSSEDSLEEVGNIRDIRLELKEVEEKFRKAMIQNAQLDNEKASLNYQVELTKDRLEDLDEAHVQLQREHREECRLHASLKRDHAQLSEQAAWTRAQLDERDALISAYGLTIVGGEDGERRALVTADNAQMLYSVGSGSLDVRLRRLAEDRDDLADQCRRLRLELEEARSQRRPVGQPVTGATVNGGLVDAEEAQRETNKILADYKFKLQKAEQDVATLQASVARLESQVVRYKGASESSERVEDELKVEKRKLQREEPEHPENGVGNEQDNNQENGTVRDNDSDEIVEKNDDDVEDVFSKRDDEEEEGEEDDASNPKDSNSTEDDDEEEDLTSTSV